MKKLYIVFSVFALTFLAAGCAKEIDSPDSLREDIITVDETTGESIITVQLSVPESEDTKTTLGSKSGSTYPVKWSAGDGSYLTLNGTAAYESTKVSDTQYSAKFKPASLSTYNFLYRGVTGQSNQVAFPANQAYVADGFDPEAMPMYASLASRADNVTFSHVASLLKFSFTGSKKIDSVTLTAVDGSMSLSGTFTIGATAGLLNGSLTPASGGGAINYNFGSHIQLSETPFVFYVAVPAGTYEGGITLNVVDNDSGHMTVTVMDTDATKTIAAGKVREFDNVVYIPAKENNLKQIWNATTFQEFVTAVAGGNKTLNARLTPSAASIDLSSIAGSFASIEGYKGTFDGNGKTLSGLTKPLFDDLKGVVKNLTLNSTISATAADDLSWGIFAKTITPSLEVDDVPGLQNCTAEGSITWTPSAALGGNGQLGGLVGNNKGGTITGCTNNANVTFANNNVTNGNQPSIGGVVGRTQKGGDLKTQGDINNCTNNGTVVCAAQFAENIYIGGVLGYQVEKAETMSGCVNHGLVKVTSTASTGGSLQLGGVLGMGKGTIESCTNASDGVVTAETCTVTSYLCQGGVVGRINRESGTYSGLSNAGTVNAAAAGPSATFVGGVVGRCNEGASITGLANSGDINASMTGSSGTTFIAGIVPRITTSISDCHTTGGTLTYSGTNADSPLYIGGIVGYTNQADVTISNCTNAMAINVGGSFSPAADNFYGTGGIIGNLAIASGTISNCLNTGSITWSQEICDSKGYSYLGGVAGRGEGTITNSSNGGTVSFEGKNDAQNPYIGGLIADTPNSADITISGKYSSASATNYGNVVVNTTVQSKKYVYVGGITGRLRCNLENTTNSGKIDITKLKCSRFFLGGIVGTNTRALGSGNANLADGDITISGLTANSDYLYVGGVVGLNSAAVSNASNAGDVVLTSGSTCKKSMFVGGVVGRGEGNISSCTNSGAVSNACPATTSGSYLQVGGIVGYNNGSSVVSDCHNTGNVSNSANCNGYVYVGGVTSEADSAVSNCDNTGNVTNSGNSAQSKWISVGGVVGFASAAITSCSNGTSSAAGGTISNSGTSNEDVNIGGVAGNNNGVAFTSCYNKGAVENSGNSKSEYNVNIGGLVGWSSANSTYSSTCYNTGAITNTGVGSNTSPVGVRMGGLIGTASGVNTLTGTSSVYNYNSGNLLENSESDIVSIGGVVGYAYNDASNFTYCRNSGNVTFSNTHANIFIGGIAGVFGNSSVIDNTTNSGAFAPSGATMKHTGSLKLGGIIGGWIGEAGVAQTITGCTNTGSITIRSNQLADTGSGAAGTSYVGGIAGGGPDDNDICSKTLYGCKNSGAITMGDGGDGSSGTNSGKLYHRFCVGGIIGWVDVNPTNSKCVANIRFRSTLGQNRIGGIAGEMMIESIHDVTYKGNVNSNGTSGDNFTGGLVGNVGTGERTFTNCTVSGTMRGPNSTTKSAGNFCSCNGSGTGPTINIASCTVGSGTRVQTANSGYSFTITSASDITASNVFGWNGSNHNCTTGTNDGNSTVVDPTTITL